MGIVLNSKLPLILNSRAYLQMSTRSLSPKLFHETGSEMENDSHVNKANRNNKSRFYDNCINLISIFYKSIDPIYDGL